MTKSKNRNIKKQMSKRQVSLRDQIVNSAATFSTLAALLRAGDVKVVLGLENTMDGDCYSCYIQDKKHSEPCMGLGLTVEEAVYNTIEEMYGNVPEEDNAN